MPDQRLEPLRQSAHAPRPTGRPALRPLAAALLRLADLRRKREHVEAARAAKGST
jgi:hypothetical protein